MNKILRWLNAGTKGLAMPNKKISVSSQTTETKSVSSVHPMVALHGFGDASWTMTDYVTLSREGYLRNPIAHRCVSLIAESAASMPWLLYDKSSEMEVHPVLDLLRRPNGRQSGQSFLENLYSSLLISGNAFVNRISLEDTPRELHLFRSDRVTPVLDENGWTVAYDYAVGNQRMRYDCNENDEPILHLQMYNPLSDHEGFSPLSSAHMALDVHNAASRWNKALLDNSARPSGALVYSTGETGNLTEEQFDRLKAELEEGYTGANRAGRPMLLEGGLDWKAMGFSPKDMDFMEAKNGAAREIALAFGVPPMLLGIPGDNTFANYKEANIALWRQTILPLVTRVSSSLDHWLLPHFQQGLRLDIDRDKIEALSVDRTALWARINEASFLTPNEKREATGYSELDSGQQLDG